MGFSFFALISLFYCVIGLRVVRDLYRNWRTAFDKNFTPADRYLVDQAAFFILVPISVALHELGHATMIWAFGGHVTGWGFYVFAGYVSYAEPFTNAQHILVAMAGPLVNVILGALAVGVVFLKRPPMRAAINELLLQFAIISVANALIFYPILDFATGLEGDWSQMYNGGVPALSFAILVVHLSILGLGFWAWKNPGMRDRIAVLTGAPTGSSRRLFGGVEGGHTAPAAGNPTVEPIMQAAAARVASGWPVPVNGMLQRRPDATMLLLSWQAGGATRAVVATAPLAGGLEIWGRQSTVAPGQPATNGTAPPLQRQLSHFDTVPDADQLTFALRLAMEEVERWQPSPQPEEESWR